MASSLLRCGVGQGGADKRTGERIEVDEIFSLRAWIPFLRLRVRCCPGGPRIGDELVWCIATRAVSLVRSTIMCEETERKDFVEDRFIMDFVLTS